MKSESHYKISKEGVIVKHEKEAKILSTEKIDVSTINIGYYLITPLLIGVFLGYLIGHELIGIIVGLVGTIYNLIKIVKSNARD